MMTSRKVSAYAQGLSNLFLLAHRSHGSDRHCAGGPPDTLLAIFSKPTVASWPDHPDPPLAKRQKLAHVERPPGSSLTERNQRDITLARIDINLVNSPHTPQAYRH